MPAYTFCVASSSYVAMESKSLELTPWTRINYDDRKEPPELFPKFLLVLLHYPKIIKIYAGDMRKFRQL